MIAHTVGLAPGEQVRGFCAGWLLVVDVVGRSFRVMDIVTREVAMAGPCTGAATLQRTSRTGAEGAPLPPSMLGGERAPRATLVEAVPPDNAPAPRGAPAAGLGTTAGLFHGDSDGSAWLDTGDSRIRADMLRVLTDDCTGWLAVDAHGSSVCAVPPSSADSFATRMRTIASALAPGGHVVGGALLTGAGISIWPAGSRHGLPPEAGRVWLGWGTHALLVTRSGAAWVAETGVAGASLDGMEPLGLALDRAQVILRNGARLSLVGGPAELSWELPPLLGARGHCWVLGDRLFVVDLGRCGVARVWMKRAGAPNWGWTEGTPVALDADGQTLLSSAQGRLLRTDLVAGDVAQIGRTAEDPMSRGAALVDGELLVLDPLGAGAVPVGGTYRLVPEPIDAAILRGWLGGV